VPVALAPTHHAWPGHEGSPPPVGNLYQVKRASDDATKDIGVVASGGFADSAQQDSFCSATTCTISIIYDPSPRGNNLTSAPAGEAKDTRDSEAIATALERTVAGHPVYAVVVCPGMGYRNDRTPGIATGDEPKGEYMVTSGMPFNNGGSIRHRRTRVRALTCGSLRLMG